MMPMISHRSFLVICVPFDTTYSLHWRVTTRSSMQTISKGPNLVMIFSSS